MSKIIHQKYASGRYTFEELQSLHNTVQETVGNDYVVLTTPTDINSLDPSTKIFCIEARWYSYDELVAIINKG